MIGVLVGIILHFLAVWLTLLFIEQQWPGLHKAIKAVIVCTVVGLLVALLRGWICSWLCP